MAGRVRVLADAVQDLTAELAQLRSALPQVTTDGVNQEAIQVAERLATAMETFNHELGGVNQSLRSLAQRPLLGMLGGGAEEAIQRLTGKVDALRKELSGWGQLVRR